MGTMTPTGSENWLARVTRTVPDPSTVGCGIPSPLNRQSSYTGPNPDSPEPASFPWAVRAEAFTVRPIQTHTTAASRKRTFASAWSDDGNEDRDGQRRECRIGDTTRRLRTAEWRREQSVHTVD